MANISKKPASMKGTWGLRKSEPGEPYGLPLPTSDPHNTDGSLVCLYAYIQEIKLLMQKINSDSTAVFSSITAPNTRRTGQRVRQAFGRLGDNPPE